MSDQERISLHYVKQISDENLRKTSIRELLVDPTSNSPNKQHKNCMVDSKENY